ncbi:MAG TPA: hypothetical protein VHZ25_17960 [Acidobacteriaceae bacterium]|jgi:hypothetical protein|nr:hypothetical protein [Acidobacteriaceae bacterium]
MAEILPISDIDQRRADAQHHSDQPDIATLIKRHAVQDLKECRWSREEVADLLSRDVRRPITVSQIDAFVAESKSHRFPLDLVAAWVRVTGSRRLLDLACAESGLYLVDEVAHSLADFGRTVLEREEITVKEARLKALLKERI